MKVVHLLITVDSEEWVSIKREAAMIIRITQVSLTARITINRELADRVISISRQHTIELAITIGLLQVREAGTNYL